ncbi:GntP family permease [Companilactobacillus bobalius]|uniref:GntP family permease n=1 Tax=Companilactobacillus bobalius TaxID=2801451 RepID=UPI001302E423|nr:Na+/H+ antiporter NhaC family protein [Companilactobacillus bobalius]KAE9560256.1 gluconate:proton symporter [Companilactobacillus bobalius]
MVIAWWAALLGLLLAIGLILFRVNPIYALIFGAIVGCLIGGMNLSQTTDVIVKGSSGVMGTIIRVIAAGVLAGVMMESGAANVIASNIVNHFSDKLAILALALSTMVLTGVGIFIPVAVLIVAPIALEVGQKMHYSKLSLLVALSGGGKAGNIISPNPNTIAAAKGFNVELSQVMIADFVPAIVGLIVTVLLATLIKNKGTFVSAEHKFETKEDKDLPSLKAAIVTPLVAVILLLITPVGDILGIKALASFNLDAMYILPIAGLIGTLAMGQRKKFLKYMTGGLARMTDVVLILIGAGAIAGLVSASDLPQTVRIIVVISGISGTFLAPIAGILMAAATASTFFTQGFLMNHLRERIMSFGISGTGAAAMVHTGATVIDQLPHGNYFHVTAKAVDMHFKERMSVVLWEMLVGLSMTIVATLMYGNLF